MALKASKKIRTLSPVRPNLGNELAYRHKLENLIEEMNRSILYWLIIAYKNNKPALAKLIAEDATPADTINTVMKRLVRRWSRRFNKAARDLAKHFALSTADRSEKALHHILERGGFSVEFKTTPAVKDILQASVHENVSLIKSIPRQHLANVEQMVMRSVQAGRDLQQLTNELQESFGVVRRRAELIARDQNNKLTAAITRTRQLECNIKKAQWVHSGAGRHPRPTHVKASQDKVIYNVAEGWLDPAINKRIWPGTEINCRCIARPVIEGVNL